MRYNNKEGKQSPVLIMDTASKLGRACARAVAERGGSLVLLTSGAELDQELRDILEQRRIHYMTADVKPWDEDGMTDLVKMAKAQFGGIHGMVYNCFEPVCGTLSGITEEAFADNYIKNIKAPFFVTQLVAASIGREELGKMIYLTSILDEKPSGKYPLYSMAMAAVKNMSREAALAYGPDGIASIVVELGLSEQAVGLSDSRYTTFFDGYSWKTPMQGGGTVEDAARLCAFLLSDECRFLTGTEIRMDGGALLHYLDPLANHRAIVGEGGCHG